MNDHKPIWETAVEPKDIKSILDKIAYDNTHCRICEARLPASRIDLSGMCYSCRAAAKEKEMEDKLDQLKSELTINQRIRRIEKLIFEHFENHVQREIRFK